ncbi:MAG: DMT family transporter [Candidatus Didemnitutus sp.]|nr:DMT family transporter [Candidatus Didemnitutus sp.]
MHFAVLTTFIFAASSILAQKSQRAVGPARANLGRLLIGLLFLGVWAYGFGRGHGGPAFSTFFWSGLIGIGLGDLAFFGALPFLGSRLTITINQCVSVPVAIAIEWLWLDTRLTMAQFACIGVILAGIVVALVPTKKDPPKVRVRPIGILLGLAAATGQGIGAVMSRRGFEIATTAGTNLDGLTAAYQRLLGGIVVTVIWFGVLAWLRRHQPKTPAPSPRAHGWVFAHAMAGPVLGMGTFQLALATSPSGLVLPITACAPLAVIPMAYWFEGERPSKRSLAGGALAVVGAVGLLLVR